MKQPTPSDSIKVPLNLPELRIIAQEISSDNTLLVKVEGHSQLASCPQCSNLSSIDVKDDHQRLLQDLAALAYKVILLVRERRFFCPKCRKRFLERFSFVAPRARLTKRLQKAIIKQAASKSLNKVAHEYQVSYRQVRYLVFAKGQHLVDLAVTKNLPKRIGVDEFATRKGHHYATVLTDLNDAHICGIEKDRSCESLKNLLGDKPARLKRVREVALDMWKPYHKAVRECLPRARRVIDRFHVQGYLSKAVSDYRKRLARENKENAEELKNSRWLLLKNESKLTDEEKQRRTELFDKFSLLKRCVYLIERLKNWYQTEKNRRQAEWQFRYWLKKLEETQVKELTQLAKKLKTWKAEIVNYFYSYASNGITEGFNTKIKLIKRVGYGRLTFEHLRAGIFLECYHPT